MLWWSFGQVRATMLRKGMRTSSIFNSHHAAKRRNMVAKPVQHVAPNSVAICCVEMLQSFGQGLDRPFARSGHMVRNKLCCEVNNVDCEQSLSFLSVFLAFLILELALSYRVASPNLHNIREVKLDVYGKRQTAKLKLLSSVFSSLYSRIKIFVFAVNGKRHFSIFV